MHAPDTKTSTHSEARISLIIGGPFYSLVGRLGLVGPDRLLGLRAAVVLAAVAWLLPAVLAVLQALLTNDRYALGYFTDPSAVARLLVGVFVLVITERAADARLGVLFDNFLGPHLVAVRDRDAVLGALLKADRWTSSRAAEAVMLAVALILPGFLIEFAIYANASAWEGRVVGGGVEMSWAGIGARYASTPLVQFLLLRWVWRLVVWARLLFEISRMPLQLSALHPDRSGGLAFLSLYPPVFNGLIFAISSAFAAAFIQDLAAATIAVQTVQLMVVAWIALVIALVIGPLRVFVPCLLALQDNAIIRYGRLAAGLNQAFERRWLAPEARGEDLLASGDSGAVGDLNAIAATIWELNVIPGEVTHGHLRRAGRRGAHAGCAGHPDAPQGIGRAPVLGAALSLWPNSLSQSLSGVRHSIPTLRRYPSREELVREYATNNSANQRSAVTFPGPGTLGATR